MRNAKKDFANRHVPPPLGAQQEASKLLTRPSRGSMIVWRGTGLARVEAADVIVVTDSAGQIILANCAALSILHPAELMLWGTTCDMLLVEGSDCPHRSLSGEQPMIERESLSRAGSLLLNISVVSIEDSSAYPCGFLHCIHVAGGGRHHHEFSCSDKLLKG